MIPTLRGENNRLVSWSIAVSKEIGDQGDRIDVLSETVDELKAILQEPEPEIQRNYSSAFRSQSTNVALNSEALGYWHYVNTSGTRNITLPSNPNIGDWIGIVNVGTGTLVVRDSGTICSLAQNEYCYFPAYGDTSGRGVWPTGSARIKSDGTIVYAGMTVSNLTATRVVFVGTSGLLTDSANFTYTTGTGQLALATTGSGAGILVGGDVQLYRSAADEWTAPDKIKFTPPTSTATSGSIYAIYASLTATPGSASSARYFGLSFDAYVTGSQNLTDSTGGLTGFQAAIHPNGTGTITAASAAIFSGDTSSTQAITTCNYVYILGLDISSGATVTTYHGLRIDGPRSSAPGGNITTCNWLKLQPRTYSAGAITNLFGIDMFSAGNMNGYTANNQVRIGLDIGAMPDPGAFTGTTTAAIRIQGTGGSRDAILMDNCRLFRGASAILHTDAGFKSLHATNGLGYGTGAGGTVTQATSKSTGVTLNKVCGQITMNNAALNAGVSVSFTLTNSAIASTDTVLVNIQSAATVDSYQVMVTAVAAGSCRIQVHNFSAANLSEALVLNFAVIKAVTA